jgi:DNA-binding MarR family transcriptional regulator
MKKAKSDKNPSVAELIAGQCLAGRVRLLSRTITGIFDEALRPLGLTAGQLNMLVMITLGGPLSPGELARGLNMEKSTMSRNIERMRKQGWIRVEAGESANQKELAVSTKGQKLLHKCLPPWQAAQNRTRELIGAQNMRSLQRTADVLRDVSKNK